jgi:hypothetical protein
MPHGRLSDSAPVYGCLIVILVLLAIIAGGVGLLLLF